MKRKKNEDGSQSVALGTIIIVLVLVLLFGLAFGFMHSLDMLFVGDFFEDLFGIGGKNNELPWDLGALSEIVQSGKDEEKEGIVLDVTYDVIREALLTESDSEGLHLNSKIRYYDGEEFSELKLSYYRYKDKFRTESFSTIDSEAADMIKVANSGKITLLDVLSGQSVTYPKPAEISSENEAGIPAIIDLLAAIRMFPSEDGPENSPLTDCVLQLVRYGESNVYYVAFTNSKTELREEYYVALDYRIIISSTTKTADGETIYSYEVTSLSTDPAIYSDESLYEITDGA